MSFYCWKAEGKWIESIRKQKQFKAMKKNQLSHASCSMAGQKTKSNRRYAMLEILMKNESARFR